jgi:hypothetical protein
MLAGRFAARAARSASLRSTAAPTARTYATPAASSKPPIALYGVDGTYATALVSFFCIQLSSLLRDDLVIEML